jgi:hypothetical protein
MSACKILHAGNTLDATVLARSSTKVKVTNPFTRELYIGGGVFVFSGQKEITFTRRHTGMWRVRGVHHSNDAIRIRL